jgi:hypothetical protein
MKVEQRAVWTGQQDQSAKLAVVVTRCAFMILRVLHGCRLLDISTKWNSEEYPEISYPFGTPWWFRSEFLSCLCGTCRRPSSPRSKS